MKMFAFWQWLCFIVFLILSINLFGDNSLDTNYTCANRGGNSSLLTPEEADDILDSAMSSHESHVLTPEELANVYADIIHSTYAKLGYISLGADLPIVEEITPQDEPDRDVSFPSGYSCNSTVGGTRTHEIIPLSDIPRKKASFEESVRQRRALMDDAHAKLGDTSSIRYQKPPKVPLPTLLKNYGLQAASYIGLAGIPKDKTEETLAALSKDKLAQVNLAMEELEETFSSDRNFRQSAKGFSKIGYFETIKRKSNKRWKPWSWNRHHYAIENFAKHVIGCVRNVIQEKNSEERCIRKKIEAELARAQRQTNERFQSFKIVRSKVENVFSEDCIENRLEELQNLKEYIEAQRAHFSELSFSEKHKLVNLALYQVESCKCELRDGIKSRFPIYKKRLIAIIETIKSNGKIENRSYEASAALKACEGDFGLDLERFKHISANNIQHNIYQEVVTVLNGAAKIQSGMIPPTDSFYDISNMAKITDVIVCSSRHAIEFGDQHEYQKSFDLIDLASGVFDIAKRVGNTIKLCVDRIADGVQEGLKEAGDFSGGDSNLSDQVLFGAVGLWDSMLSLLKKVKEEPIEESIGDSIQFLSRKITKVAVTAGVVVGAVIAVESGIAAATGVMGAVAAKDLLEPLVAEVASHGSAVAERAASSVIPFCEAIATPLAQACEKLYGFSNAINNFLFAMQGGGPGGKKVEGQNYIRKNIKNIENRKGLKAFELKFSKTVQNHTTGLVKKGPFKGELIRPYLVSDGKNMLVDEIMSARSPVADKILENGLKWDVPGFFRGSNGIWELVIDVDSNTIVHFNFVKS